VPAFAGDIVSMPTGNMVPAGKIELNYIHWNLKTPPNGPGDTEVGELFMGVTDRLELDVDTLHTKDGLPNGKKNVTEVNAYFKLIDETDTHPSLIVGATNIAAANFLPNSADINGDNVSPFVLGAYNVQVPQGPPTWSDPLIRLQAGYGTHAHEKQPFGGFQFLFTPKIGAAWFNYTGAPAYMGVYMPNSTWQVRGGWFRGAPFGSLGLDCKW